MHLSRIRLVRRGAVVVAAAAGLLGGLVVQAIPSSATVRTTGHTRSAHRHPGWTSRAVVPGSTYLALGDSVTFGYREPANLPTPVYADQASFVGYPEEVGSALGVHVVNPSCPGETSGSFISLSNPSYACETPTGYRTNFPLHVSYSGSQLDFAVGYLRHHPDVRLVSLLIGANDGFLCQATTADKCVSEYPALLAKVKANIDTILTAIRDRAHYRGQLIVLDYYSLNYADPVGNATTVGLDQAIRSAASGYGTSFGDAYAAFEHAAEQSEGNSCTAGLLTQLTTGGCGVHPSVAGQDVLAHVVEAAIRR